MDGLIVASGNIVAVFIAAYFTARAARRAEAEAALARRVAEKTHQLVNGQKTLMLRALLVLTMRIARENPNDMDAQEAADKAGRDLHDAERANA
jgi:hypothetical protein